MGYASRNNSLSRDKKLGKIKPYNRENELKHILLNKFGLYHGAKECWLKGLISWEEMKELQKAYKDNKSI